MLLELLRYLFRDPKFISAVVLIVTMILNYFIADKAIVTAIIAILTAILGLLGVVSSVRAYRARGGPKNLA